MIGIIVIIFTFYIKIDAIIDAVINNNVVIDDYKVSIKISL